MPTRPLTPRRHCRHSCWKTSDLSLVYLVAYQIIMYVPAAGNERIVRNLLHFHIRRCDARRDRAAPSGTQQGVGRQGAMVPSCIWTTANPSGDSVVEPKISSCR